MVSGVENVENLNIHISPLATRSLQEKGHFGMTTIGTKASHRQLYFDHLYFVEPQIFRLVQFYLCYSMLYYEHILVRFICNCN